MQESPEVLVMVGILSQQKHQAAFITSAVARVGLDGQCLWDGVWGEAARSWHLLSPGIFLFEQCLWKMENLIAKWDFAMRFCVRERKKGLGKGQAHHALAEVLQNLLKNILEGVMNSGFRFKPTLTFKNLLAINFLFVHVQCFRVSLWQSSRIQGVSGSAACFLYHQLWWAICAKGDMFIINLNTKYCLFFWHI